MNQDNTNVTFELKCNIMIAISEAELNAMWRLRHSNLVLRQGERAYDKTWYRIFIDRNTGLMPRNEVDYDTWTESTYLK